METSNFELRRRKVPTDRLISMVIDAFDERGYSPLDIVMGGRTRFTEAFRRARKDFPPYLIPWSVADIAEVYDAIEAIAQRYITEPVQRSDNTAKRKRGVDRH